MYLERAFNALRKHGIVFPDALPYSRLADRIGAHQPDWGLHLARLPPALLKVDLDPYARLMCRVQSTEQLREAGRRLFPFNGG